MPPPLAIAIAVAQSLSLSLSQSLSPSLSLVSASCIRVDHAQSEHRHTRRSQRGKQKMCRGVGGGGRGSYLVRGEGEWAQLAWNSAHEIFRCLPYLSTSCIICTFVLLIKDISQIPDIYVCVCICTSCLAVFGLAAHSVATN